MDRYPLTLHFKELTCYLSSKHKLSHFFLKKQGLKFGPFGFKMKCKKGTIESPQRRCGMRTVRWVMVITILLMFGAIDLSKAQEGAITDKSQVTFRKDSTGYVFLGQGVDLKAYDTVVISEFSIAGLPDIGPGKLEEYRDTYRVQLRTKLTAAGIFKEVTDDQAKASGPNTLIIWGDILAMHPGSSAARFWVGMGAGKAVAEIKTYVSTAEEKKILLAHHLRPTSGIRGGALGAREGYAFLNQGVDRISTYCVEYIKRVYQIGR